ncbi:MAG: FAD-dependent oxidoreductase, partial [Bacteroidota bacterium]
MKNYDFLIVGAGIFGISAALELRKAGYRVCVLNPTQGTDPLAAGTDISKVVRIEYGSDEEYLDMTLESMDIWRAWNELFGETFYH